MVQFPSYITRYSFIHTWFDSDSNCIQVFKWYSCFCHSCADHLLNILLVQIPCNWRNDTSIPENRKNTKRMRISWDNIYFTKMETKENHSLDQCHWQVRTVSKIREKVLKKQWTEHLEKEGTLTDKQFWFRKEKSWVTNLLIFYTKALHIYNTKKKWIS